MSWEERLQKAVYTSPGGSVFDFDYENVSMSTVKKTTEFNFSDRDGAYIQDNGAGGRKYPVTLFFVGADCDLTANSFLLAVEEKGIGQLNHPIYGNLNVVPTGSPTRRDDLVDGANIVSWEVEFSETILPEDFIFPDSNKDTETEIADTGEEFQDNASENFSESVETETPNDEAVLSVDSAESVNTVSNLENVEDFNQIKNAFLTLKEAYSETVKDPVNNKSSMSRQLILLTRLPANIETDILKVLDIYDKQVDLLTNTTEEPNGTKQPENSFQISYVQAGASMTGMCEACTIATINSRNDALNAAGIIADNWDKTKNYLDESTQSLGIMLSDSSFSNLLKQVSQTTAYLINRAFDLPSEKRVVLADDRQILEFLTSVGLSINQYDEFIEWNLSNIGGDEIEILTAGTEVVYYE